MPRKKRVRVWPKGARIDGLDFDDEFIRILDAAIEDFKRESALHHKRLLELKEATERARRRQQQ